MHTVTIARPTSSLHIRSWEPNADGQPACGTYVEQFWLGVLGPTATLLLRRFAVELDKNPRGIIFTRAALANSLGVKDRGPHGPFEKAIERLVRFEIARWDNETLEVRTVLPLLSRRHLMKLNEDLRSLHDFFETQRRSANS